jgi:hypothetical protein
VLGRLCGSSPFLTALKLGVGANVNDSLLEKLAGSWRDLHSLDLRLCAVSGSGGRGCLHAPEGALIMAKVAMVAMVAIVAVLGTENR